MEIKLDWPIHCPTWHFATCTYITLWIMQNGTCHHHAMQIFWMNSQILLSYTNVCCLFHFTCKHFLHPGIWATCMERHRYREFWLKQRYNISIELNNLYLFLDPFHFTMDITACTCSIQAHHCYSMKFNTNTCVQFKYAQNKKSFFFWQQRSAFGIQMYKLCFWILMLKA